MHEEHAAIVVDIFRLYVLPLHIHTFYKNNFIRTTRLKLPEN